MAGLTGGTRCRLCDEQQIENTGICTAVERHATGDEQSSEHRSRVALRTETAGHCGM